MPFCCCGLPSKLCLCIWWKAHLHSDTYVNVLGKRLRIARAKLKSCWCWCWFDMSPWAPKGGHQVLRSLYSFSLEESSPRGTLESQLQQHLLQSDIMTGTCFEISIFFYTWKDCASKSAKMNEHQSVKFSVLHGPLDVIPHWSQPHFISLCNHGRRLNETLHQISWCCILTFETHICMFF